MWLSLEANTAWLPDVIKLSGVHKSVGTEDGENHAWKSQHGKTPMLGIASPSAGAAFKAKEKPAETNLGGCLVGACTKAGISSFCRLVSTTHPALLCRICAWREWKGKNIFFTSKPHFGKPSRVFSIPCFLQAQLNFLLTRGGYQTGASNQLAWEIAQPSPGERKERAQQGVASAELKRCLYVCGK